MPDRADRVDAGRTFAIAKFVASTAFLALVLWFDYFLAVVTLTFALSISALCMVGSTRQLTVPPTTRRREFYGHARRANAFLVAAGVVAAVPLSAAPVTGNRVAEWVAVGVGVWYALTWLVVEFRLWREWHSDTVPRGAVRLRIPEIVARAVPDWLRDVIERRHGAATLGLIVAIALTMLAGAGNFAFDDPAWAREALWWLRHGVSIEQPAPRRGSARPSPYEPPCPPVGQVREDMLAAVAGAAGRRLFDAWEEVGVGLVGCPVEYERVGTLWTVTLSGGRQGGGLVVGDDVSAAVVFESDFEQIVRATLPDAAAVSKRVRWGYGTMQVVVSSNGSCRLLQRYQSTTDEVFDLPPAVTAVAARIATTAHAYPRILGVTGSPERHYEVRLLKPGARANGSRIVRHVTVTYERGTGAHAEGISATDDERCPVSVRLLTGYADLLERSVQRVTALGPPNRSRPTVPVTYAWRPVARTRRGARSRERRARSGCRPSGS